MTDAQRDQAFEIVWDGAHREQDADLLRPEWAVPEKCVAVAPPSRAAYGLFYPQVAVFLKRQASSRWWTVAEIAQVLHAQRESVRSALRQLTDVVERRSLTHLHARDPRWAFRWTATGEEKRP